MPNPFRCNTPIGPLAAKADAGPVPGNFPADPFGHFTCFRNSFLPDISLLEIREQCTCGNLGMVEDRDESPGFRIQEMNMSAGLAYRVETKNGEDFNYSPSDGCVRGMSIPESAVVRSWLLSGCSDMPSLPRVWDYEDAEAEQAGVMVTIRSFKDRSKWRRLIPA